VLIAMFAVLGIRMVIRVVPRPVPRMLVV
jgi:hypothetical protein